MAKADLLEETGQRVSTPGTVDILVGITGPAELDQVRVAAEAAGAAMDRNGSGLCMAVAYPGMEDAADDAESAAQLPPNGVELLAYKTTSTAGNGAHWLASGATYSSLFALAQTTGAKCLVVANADLEALQYEAVASLAAPVLAGDCELAMPIYAQGRFEGLLNAGILAPLTRALYGKRVRYPLAQDFAVSASMLPVLEHPSKRLQGGDSLFWPATEAATRDRKTCQVYVNVRHEHIAEGVDLSTVLTQVVGPLFTDIETNAAIWQRTRGSHAIPTTGSAFPVAEGRGPIDTKPMVESFQLALNNLQDLWSLVLPPVTQLELKRLGRATPEQFRMPDELWAKIVYDFALAHRLKILSRSHLMGAFTPLYLAWVASYANEVAAIPDAAADARHEQLAQAYEAGKPYLLSRWRWPDRFNP
jgi:hypothetical protein